LEKKKKKKHVKPKKNEIQNKKNEQLEKKTKKKRMWRGESYSTFPTPFRVLVNYFISLDK